MTGIAYIPPNLILNGVHMRKFMTELLGKRMMTSDGSMVGTIVDLLIDDLSGEIEFVMVMPDGEGKVYFGADEDGRVPIPFTEMKSVRDVVVMDID